MIKTTPKRNKTLVLQAFDTLFKEFEAAKRYWSSNYIQHSAHMRSEWHFLQRNWPFRFKFRGVGPRPSDTA
jgi:hypothetical protein